jgi:DNA-binding beta-propeller fold protein YncE
MRKNATYALILISTIIMTIYALNIFFLPIQITYGHHVLKEIKVTERPMKISLDDPLLFVSNLGEPLISIISTVSDNVVGTINTTNGVIDVEGILDKKRVYVATFQTGELEVYDITTKELIKKIPIPGSTIQFPQRLADTALVTSTVITGGSSLEYNPNNEMLYIANYNTDEIIVVDTKNNDTIVDTIDVTPHPMDLKVDPVTNQLLVTSCTSTKMTFISADTNEIVGTVETGISSCGIDIDNSKSLAYIANFASPYVAVVDIKNQKVVDKIPIGLESQLIVVDTNEHKIYVAFDDLDRIVKINGDNNEIETVIELEGKIPNDMVIDSVSHKVYASIKFSNSVLVMGPESYAISMPVVTQELPILFVDNIILHGQDVKPVNPVLIGIENDIYNLTKFAFLNSENKSLTLEVNSADGGNLQIKLPKTILDSITEVGNVTDTEFTVLVDGVKTEHKETTTASLSQTVIVDGRGQEQQQDTSREISVFIPKGVKKVDIIGKGSPPS